MTAIMPGPTFAITEPPINHGQRDRRERILHMILPHYTCGSIPPKEVLATAQLIEDWILGKDQKNEP